MYVSFHSSFLLSSTLFFGHVTRNTHTNLQTAQVNSDTPFAIRKIWPHWSQRTRLTGGRMCTGLELCLEAAGLCCFGSTQPWRSRQNKELQLGLWWETSPTDPWGQRCVDCTAPDGPVYHKHTLSHPSNRPQRQLYWYVLTRSGPWWGLTSPKLCFWLSWMTPRSNCSVVSVSEASFSRFPVPCVHL
jgi:hypothetical protein